MSTVEPLSKAPNRAFTDATEQLQAYEYKEEIERDDEAAALRMEEVRVEVSTCSRRNRIKLAINGARSRQQTLAIKNYCTTVSLLLILAYVAP